MIGEVRELWRYREVLFGLVRRNLKIRYKNSVLGFLWSFLNPLMLIGVYWFVFKVLWESTEPNYTVKVFCMFLPWIFFSQSLLDSAACVGMDMALVKKAYFPRSVLPLSVVVSNLVHLCFGFVVLMLVFAGTYLTFTIPISINRYFLLVIPLLILLTGLTYGLSLLISAVSVFYADVRFILGSVLQVLFFSLPILYGINKALLSDRMSTLLKSLYLSDPLTPILLGFQSALLYGGRNPIPPAVQHLFPYQLYLGIAVGVTVVCLALGHAVFKRLEWTFPEHG